jgi:hypothetical protein
MFDLQFQHSQTLTKSVPPNPLKMPPQNEGTWLSAPATPLEVAPAPCIPTGPQEIVIKNGAVAINSVDWIIPDKRAMMFQWIKDPSS